MPRRPNRILLVDDEPNVLSALTRTLRREPYEVVTTESAQHALTLLRGEDFDLVIADYLMPEMNGLEFLSRVRRVQPEPMRMMLTGHADVETVVAAINDGAICRFLTKPWDTAELRVTLKLCFEHQALARENRELSEQVAASLKLIDEVTERTRDAKVVRVHAEPES